MNQTNMAGCKIHSLLNPLNLIPHKRTQNAASKQHPTSYYSSFPPNPVIFRTTNMNLNEQQFISTATINNNNSVHFKTLGACKLGISRYPDFVYNAEGGRGSGTANSVFVDFDVETMYIPPLSTATTKFLGLPLPPFLKIDIVPEAFQGKIDQESGEVELKFRARFLFSIGSIYKAQPLLVDTVLTSEESKGEMKGGRGERVDKDGMCKLVGVAKVEPINDIFMDTFLSLPTECLASLNAIISFSA